MPVDQESTHRKLRKAQDSELGKETASISRHLAAQASTKGNISSLPFRNLAPNSTANGTEYLLYHGNKIQNEAAMFFNDVDLQNKRLISGGDSTSLAATSAHPASATWANGAWNSLSSYPTTLLLLILVHTLFFYHWNTRKTRRDVMGSYKHLVEQKQFHRAVLCVLSHPPSNTTTHTGRDEYTYSHNLQASSSSPPFQDTTNTSTARIRAFLEPLTTGHLSGLPLLFYNSHILWSCRALEAAVYNQHNYIFVLLALATVAMLLELKLLHWRIQLPLPPTTPRNGESSSDTDVLHRDLSSRIETSNSRTRPSSSPLQDRLRHRPMGTLTILTSSLLIVFQSHFPRIPLQVLPWIPDRFLFSILLLQQSPNPKLTWFLAIMILAVLSYKSHPITSVVFGSASGLLWSIGLTSFFQELYWGRALLLLWIVLCSLSMKTTTTLSNWVPCVDHVAWNARGDIVVPREGLSSSPRNFFAQDDSSSSSSDDAGNADLEQPSTTSLGTGVRGRIPILGEMEDADDGLGTATRSFHATPPTVRSRRPR